jgi:NAD(P)-dependent dehydrogenase (short-subunit alcohol dehydrogenase family)
MTKLAHKVVAVTGAASGIGRALAQKLCQRGAAVALADVNEVGLRETAELCGGGSRVTTHVVDVRDREAIRRWAAEAEAAHGGVDVIINNAGLTVRAGIEEVSDEHFERVIGVNLWGVIHGTRVFLPLLRKRPEGHIVNISSINGLVPFAKNGPYNVSKYGVLGFTETLMQELSGQPIRVTCVHPGGIRTGIVRNAIGSTEDEVELFDRIAMTSAEQAAETILRGIERNKQRVYVGMDSKIMAIAKRLLPAATVRLVGRMSMEPAPARLTKGA